MYLHGGVDLHRTLCLENPMGGSVGTPVVKTITSLRLSWKESPLTVTAPSAPNTVMYAKSRKQQVSLVSVYSYLISCWVSKQHNGEWIISNVISL